MGLPNIEIIFKSLGASAIKRGSRGVVALILKDSVGGLKEYTSLEEIKDKYSTDNMDYITKCFLGCPNKVLVCTISDKQTVSDALSLLKNKKWNYLAMPEGVEADNTSISTFIKEQRKNKKTFKAVLANTKADNEGVINFTSYNIKVKDKFYASQQYTCRIAGILAGLSLNRSATYYVLNEIEDVVQATDPNNSIDNGELILINDGEKVKIARAVNSLTTTSEGKGEDYKKIKIVEIMDLINSDIRQTFEDNYIGKYSNSYDNKCLLIVAINAYLESLEREGILAKDKNKVSIDCTSNELFLKSKGISTDNMSKQEIKEIVTGSNVFLTGNCRPLDAMEDLIITFEMM